MKGFCIECGKELSRKRYTRCSKCKTKDPNYIKKLSESHKGLPAWNKNIPVSEETKLKISIANKGNSKIGQSSQFKTGNKPWNKGIALPQMRGENSPHWKGGNSYTEEKKMRSRVEWKLMREKVFKRDNYTCQECGERGCELHPHHVLPKSQYPELAYSIENVVTLCKGCHISPGKHKFCMEGK